MDVQTFAKEIKRKYTKFDDFIANEFGYLVQHAERLNIDYLELEQALFDSCCLLGWKRKGGQNGE